MTKATFDLNIIIYKDFKIMYQSDQKNGTYKNPIIYADLSDPDVIRVGDDFYMVSSSFTYVPGVPLLHSKDLVNWERINYCVRTLPFPHYNRPVHGSGTWAPAIRYHEGIFYVFVPMPDEGIFVTSTRDPYGEWSELNCIMEGKGLIDPCPFWDTDGKAYMIHAFAYSRSGIKSKLALCEITPDCTGVLGKDLIIIDGTLTNPTLEGPKMYKRNGYYYVLAPAGGVKTGWQVAYRSKNVYGPYEYKVVLEQGETRVNGPHQGALVTGSDNNDYFIHFCDVGVMGRITWLEPVTWVDDWPVMGNVEDGSTGTPVLEYKIPVGSVSKYKTPGESGDKINLIASDDFKSNILSLLWQWQANPDKAWYECNYRHEGLKLNVMRRFNTSVWYMPNVLTTLPLAPEFTAKVTSDISNLKDGDALGLCMLGMKYSCVTVTRHDENISVGIMCGTADFTNGNVDKNNACVTEKVVYEENVYVGNECPEDIHAEEIHAENTHKEILHSGELTLIMHIKDEKVKFGFILNGKERSLTDTEYPFTEGRWVGAKVAIFVRGESDGFAVLKKFEMN